MLTFQSSDPGRDVLVTGIGMVTPLGHGAESTWQQLIAGIRAPRRLNAGDIDGVHRLQIPGMSINGAPVCRSALHRYLADSAWSELIPARVWNAWAAEPMVAMTLFALDEALRQARISTASSSPERVSVVYGSSKGGLKTAEGLTSSFYTAGPDAIDRERWEFAFSPDSAQRAIRAVTRAAGPCVCPVAACATGLLSVLQGAMLIHSGAADVCVTGSADAALRPSVLSSFHRLRVTSRDPEASTACKPFDRNRDGFVPGEGAAVIILESRRHAELRAAVPLARISGGGWLCDPAGMTQIDPSGRVVAELLNRTLGNELPQAMGLHGTGTETNDLAEARGLAVFGKSRAWEPPCFAVKGALGHLLGAAGSVETALTLLALKLRMIPGTANLHQQDPECPILLSPAPQQIPHLRSIARLSLGFGGHVVCGVFDAPES